MEEEEEEKAEEVTTRALEVTPDAKKEEIS